MPSPLWTDHRSRIAFYVRNGLVPRAPSDEQLRLAFEQMRKQVGALGQLRYYARHPTMMLPTARKRAATRRSMTARAQERHRAPHEIAADEAETAGARAPLFDRSLERMFLFPPARLAAQFAHNPWAVVQSTGLNVPRRFLISHIVHTNHPPPAIWDMQIVQGDEGGLEELDCRLVHAMRARDARARIDRALGCREGYFEYLREWIPRVRRFEYPAVPAGLDPIAENLVDYLRHAAELPARDRPN